MNNSDESLTIKEWVCSILFFLALSFLLFKFILIPWWQWNREMSFIKQMAPPDDFYTDTWPPTAP